MPLPIQRTVARLGVQDQSLEFNGISKLAIGCPMHSMAGIVFNQSGSRILRQGRVWRLRSDSSGQIVQTVLRQTQARPALRSVISDPADPAASWVHAVVFDCGLITDDSPPYDYKEDQKR
jgi:hypothetical protein